MHKTLPFVQVKNAKAENGSVTINRTIKAKMHAYLVNDKDSLVPQEMTNLTGITQALLDTYGKTSEVVDNELASFYAGKKVMLGAHNTPYDARVIRANAPNLYKVLQDNPIYDSALFSKDRKLAYDVVQMSNFDNVKGLPKSIYFFNNQYSDVNLTKFIESSVEGHYPDRSGRYLLSYENGDYFLVDRDLHEITLIEANKELLLQNIQLGDLPNNSVKYSVEKLSEQWMIHALLLSDELFAINYVDLSLPKYKSLSKLKSQLHYFQTNYHFDTSPEANRENFIKYCDNFEDASFNLEELQLFAAEFVPEFLELNKVIQQKFSDAWMYKKVLAIKEPDRESDLTNDLIDLVVFQTMLPREKVKTIFKEALAFKKKYGIDHIIQHESHMNGAWEGDSKGDVAFEDKLTLSLLAQRNYDPYNHSNKKAISEFNKFSLRARFSFEMADKITDDVPFDSYSFRQSLQFDRDNKSSIILNIEGKEASLADGSEKVIVYKLNKDILPVDTLVYAITKKGVKLDRAQIEKDSIMLSFILATLQIDQSFDGPFDVADVFTEVMKANNAQALEYKLELGKRYRFVEFSKKVLQMKKLLETMMTTINEGFYKEPKRKPKIVPENFMSLHDLDKVKSIIGNYIELAKNNKDTYPSAQGIEEAFMFFETVKAHVTENKPRLESAMSSSDLDFKTYKELQDLNFLSSTKIDKQNPLKILLNDNSDLKLTDRFIEAKMAEFA